MTVDSADSPLGRKTRSFFNGTMDVRVYEEDQPQAGRALVFETDYGRRYAFAFPTDWHSMTDAELADLAVRIRD